MAESKKGHNLAILGLTEKKYIFCADIKFKGSIQTGFQNIVGTYFSQKGE